MSIALFAWLAVLFLQRSVEPEPRDRMYQYAPPAIACAAVDYIGDQSQRLDNLGLAVLAWALVACVIVYVVFVLHPFGRTPPE